MRANIRNVLCVHSLPDLCVGGCRPAPRSPPGWLDSPPSAAARWPQPRCSGLPPAPTTNAHSATPFSRTVRSVNLPAVQTCSAQVLREGMEPQQSTQSQIHLVQITLRCIVPCGKTIMIGLFFFNHNYKSLYCKSWLFITWLLHCTTNCIYVSIIWLIVCCM